MKTWAFLFCGLAINSAAFCQTDSGAAPKRTILACAHRGEHRRHPENSLPAIQAAIDAGLDFVELDVRTTADGQLVLMHDRTVDRMTDGKGPVASMTLAEIRKLDLGARFPGQFPGLRVPTFDEALQLAKGRIGIYIDTKDATAKDLVAAIDRHDMGTQVIFFSDYPDFLKQISDLRPDWALMPEAFNAQNVRTLAALLHPKFLGFDQRDFDKPTVAAAKTANTSIFADRQTEAQWREAIEMGAAGIQTDYPEELMAFLRTNGYHP